MSVVAPLVRTTLWSTFEAAGGTALCEVRWQRDDPAVTWRSTGEHELKGRVAYDAEAAAHLESTDLLVLRLTRADGGFDEWLVSEVRPGRRSATLEVTAAPARAYLGILPPVKEIYPAGAVPDVTFTRTWPAVQFWWYEMQAAAGGPVPGWITKGTWDDQNLTVTIALDRSNPLEVCLQIAEQLQAQTGATYLVQLRPTSTTTYELDIVRAPSSREIRIEEGRNLQGLRIVRRRASLPTIIVPRGTTGAVLADAWWRVASGAGTTWVLEGWDGIGSPVPFDDCWNGAYLKKMDGTVVQITDCTAPATLVLTSGTGIAVGDRVQLPFDANGNATHLLGDPQRAVDLVGRRDYAASARTNFLRAGSLGDGQWSGGLPIGWTITTNGGTSYHEETNTVAWEYGGAALFWEFDGVTPGIPNLSMLQTFAMPHRLRNRAWSGQVRAWASGAAGCTMAVDLYTTRGITTQTIEIAGRSGIDDWVIKTVTVDESAAGTGAWTGGIRVRIFQGAITPARNGYVDLAMFIDDADETPVFGSQPGLLVTNAAVDLVAARTPERYEIEVLDRARADWARYSHEAYEIGATGRLVVPSRGIDARLPIAELQVQEGLRTRTHLSLASAPPRLTTSL